MRSRSRRVIQGMCGAVAIAVAAPPAHAAAPRCDDPVERLLVSGLAGSTGSTVGPDGAIYVAESATGRITRIDPDTGTRTTFATGLPPRVLGLGGVMDVVFLRGTAYAVVGLVGSDVGGTSQVGVYRVDGPDDVTLVADLGAFALANPPDTDFFVPTGVPYALEAYRGDLLVTDGHHNRILRVTPDGEITVALVLGNVVPTGLEVHGRTVYMAEAGPVPHLPDDGRVMAFRLPQPDPREVASGGRLLVDVELGRGQALYALAQGTFRVGDPEGAPAQPDTGELLRVQRDGSLAAVADGLDRPTSMEIVGATAYVVTLDGEVWTVDLRCDVPFGPARKAR